jgi:hypothetical protein
VLYDDEVVVVVSFMDRDTGVDSGCNGRGAGNGSGEEARDGIGESVRSVVRRPRSLMVNFCGLTMCSGGGTSRCDCCDAMGPFDSSDELSVPSGVESESNSGRGDRRFRARRC